MSTLTSLDALYDALLALTTRATGRRAWRKGGIQAQPVGTYATVLLSPQEGLEKEVVEDVELPQSLDTGETIQQVPWGTSLVRCRVEFYRSAADDSALQAAARLRAALRLEERFWDLWRVAALSGGVSVEDVSGSFRADVEPRAEVRFNLYANLALPLPLADAPIYEIDSVGVHVIHVRQDTLETEIDVTVNAPEGDS